jgi:hypothetical protein
MFGRELTGVHSKLSEIPDRALHSKKFINPGFFFT